MDAAVHTVTPVVGPLDLGGAVVHLNGEGVFSRLQVFGDVERKLRIGRFVRTHKTGVYVYVCPVVHSLQDKARKAIRRNLPQVKLPIEPAYPFIHAVLFRVVLPYARYGYILPVVPA